MTYYPDLSTNSMVWRGPHIRAVGWLSSDHEYTRGQVDRESLELLHDHISKVYQVSFFMGPHLCEFCHEKMGTKNLLIPTVDLVYIAPELITHYIEVHGYQPPAEFMAALKSCPPQGSANYLRLLKKYFHYDPLPTGEQIEKLALLVDKGLSEISQLCYKNNLPAAAAMAHAMGTIIDALHGLEGWNRHLFARLVNKSRDRCPMLEEFLAEYNAIFGEDTAAELPRPPMTEFQSMD